MFKQKSNKIDPPLPLIPFSTNVPFLHSWLPYHPLSRSGQAMEEACPIFEQKCNKIDLTLNLDSIQGIHIKMRVKPAETPPAAAPVPAAQERRQAPRD